MLFIYIGFYMAAGGRDGDGQDVHGLVRQRGTHAIYLQTDILSTHRHLIYETSVESDVRIQEIYLETRERWML